MSIDVDAIRARLDGATNKPWKQQYCRVHGADDWRMFETEHDADAHFITNAPADIAALLAEVEQLRTGQRLHEMAMRTAQTASMSMDEVVEGLSRLTGMLAELDRLRKIAEAAAAVIDSRGDRSMKHLGAHEQLVAALDAWKA